MNKNTFAYQFKWKEHCPSTIRYHRKCVVSFPKWTEATTKLNLCISFSVVRLYIFCLSKSLWLSSLPSYFCLQTQSGEWFCLVLWIRLFIRGKLDIINRASNLSSFCWHEYRWVKVLAKHSLNKLSWIIGVVILFVKSNLVVFPIQQQ